MKILAILIAINMINHYTTLEKYSYKVLFKNAFSSYLPNNLQYTIPNTTTSWNLSFWGRIHTNGSSAFLSISSNSFSSTFSIIDNILNFKNKLILYELGGFEIDTTDQDFKNKSASLNTWFFLSINYHHDFQKLVIIFNSLNKVIEILSAYLLPSENSLISFNPVISNIISNTNFNILFANVHFFENIIPLIDFEEIKNYPEKILGLYKFKTYLYNNNNLINYIDHKDDLTISIENKNNLPFGNDSFAIIDLSFPPLNDNIVMQNLIICIKGTIVFRNIIKGNQIHLNQPWNITWYERFYKPTGLNTFKFDTLVTYENISISSHVVKFSTNIKIQTPLNNINENVSFSLDIGDYNRNDFKLDILAIIKITDLPDPVKTTKNQNISLEIDALNIYKSYSVNFPLSFYDDHFFRLFYDKNKPLLYYFVLDEIIFYTGKNYSKTTNQNYYLGSDNKFILKCNKKELLRVLPNFNEKLILNKCIENLPSLLCPNSPNCIFCQNGICQLCKEEYFLDSQRLCQLCQYPNVKIKNQCLTTIQIPFSSIPNYDWSYNNGKVVILLINISSLENANNLSSPKYDLARTIYYFKNQTNGEIPSNLNLLIKTSEFTSNSIYQTEINPPLNSSVSLVSNYGCPTTTNYYAIYTSGTFQRLCVSACQSTNYIWLNFCTGKFWYMCLSFDSNQNCLICTSGYLLNNGYCNPLSFENIPNFQNKILEVICNTTNCDLCTEDGITCYVCLPGYILNSNNTCQIDPSYIPSPPTPAPTPTNNSEIIMNCIFYDDIFCLQCDLNYVLIHHLNRCINKNFVIQNCDNYEDGLEQYCKICKEAYFLYKDYDLIDPGVCIENYHYVEFCHQYSSDFDCQNCQQDYFLFKSSLFEKAICIAQINFIYNCLKYNQEDHKCFECEEEYILVNGFNDLKFCLRNNQVIKDCAIYSEYFDCIKYNEYCDPKLDENCDNCETGFLMLNDKCEDICSEKVLRCDSCPKTCFLEICKKIVQNCISCDSNDIIKCKECENGYTQQNGLCIDNENFEELYNKNCTLGCAHCYNSSCLNCEFGYIYDEKNRICDKNKTLIEYKLVYDECDKDLDCVIDGNFKNQQCLKCRINCDCQVIYKDDSAYLECSDNKVIFSNENITNKYIDLKNLIVKRNSKYTLKLEFKDRIQKEEIIQIPIRYIQSSKNCLFNPLLFYKIKNEKYVKKIIDDNSYSFLNPRFNLIPILTNMSGLQFFFVFFQNQELLSYLNLINFNGGEIYQYVNDIEFDPYKFSDLNEEKYEYQKKYIFKQRRYSFLNFIHITDLLMIASYILKEIIIFLFVLVKTIYYCFRKREILKRYIKEYLIEFRKRAERFFFQFCLAWVIKNFAMFNKYFEFHGLFINIWIETTYIFFIFFIHFVTFYYLKIQYCRTITNIDYEEENDEGDLKIKKSFYKKHFILFEKNGFQIEDQIINRIFYFNTVAFLFRSFLLQNYFQYKLFVFIAILCSYIFIFCMIFIKLKKNQLKTFISVFVFHELFFMIYLILGQFFLKEMISNIVLDVFYLIVNIFKIVENVILYIYVYKYNKNKETPNLLKKTKT